MVFVDGPAAEAAHHQDLGVFPNRGVVVGGASQEPFGARPDLDQHLAFAGSPKFFEAAARSAAGCIIALPEFAGAAGQTVMHLHIHLIPRFFGDVIEPQGGVRNVIPGKGAYA